MLRRYRLKKDLPELKAGAVFSPEEVFSEATHYNAPAFNPDYALAPTPFNLPAWIVENNPDWFEPIQEKSDKEFLMKWIDTLIETHRNCAVRNSKLSSYLAMHLIETFDIDVGKIRDE